MKERTQHELNRLTLVTYAYCNELFIRSSRGGSVPNKPLPNDK